MFGKNKKAITVVLLNEPLPPEEEHAAKEAGFSRFCLRRNLLSQIPVFIDQILENRKKKSMTELKRLEEEDAKRNARRLSPMGE
jgi:DNA-directed RNA polymerase subunit N (RpoN/RPB10)